MEEGKGEDIGTQGVETPMQKSREGVTLGRSWRRQLRIGCAGRVSSTAFASLEAKGLSKQASKQANRYAGK